MHRIISWYNQNRKLIGFLIVASFIVILISWNLINRYSKNETLSNEKKSEIDTNAYNSISMTTQSSVISKDNLVIDQLGIEVIDEFVSYCNSGKIEDAYKLISNECKEEMYPELKNFENMYYRPIFNGEKKNVEVQNWIGDIYKIDYIGNLLSTGSASKSNNLQDYITTVRDSEGNIKLNINKYIKSENMNNIKSTSNIDIRIIKRDTYMDYEIYTFEVKNNSENVIALFDVQDMEATYLLDSNNLKYKAYMHELSQAQVIVQTKETKKISVKYYNEYSSSRDIKGLSFEKIITKYNEAEKALNRHSYYTSVNFDL